MIVFPSTTRVVAKGPVVAGDDAGRVVRSLFIHEIEKKRLSSLVSRLSSLAFATPPSTCERLSVAGV